MTPSDLAFTDRVKAVQTRKGSRKAYERMEQNGGWSVDLTPELVQFIGEQNSFFLATANSKGQPYIQHRGGPPGFVQVLGPHTLGFADFAGNRQYISLGNLEENDKVHLFFIDYAHRQRVKVWGTAKVIENDPALVKRLTVEGGTGKPERAIVIEITTWDINCPQHIPQLVDVREVQRVLDEKDRRIAELEAKVLRR